MPVLASFQQKGGVGKTTTAVHLAVWLKNQGYSVLVIDADHQRSASHWLSAVSEELPVLNCFEQGDLIRLVAEQKPNYAYIVIDSPPQLQDLARGILFASDVAIAPLQPTGLDLDAATGVVSLVQEARLVRGGLPKAAFFISRAVKGTTLKEEASAAISRLEEITPLKAIIHQRQCVADCFGQGETVFTLSGRPAAESAREFTHLFKELMELTNDKA